MITRFLTPWNQIFASVMCLISPLLRSSISCPVSSILLWNTEVCLCGPTSMPRYVLADRICCIFILIFLKRQVPQYFKVSNIQPIPKNKKPTNPAHNRPISLTSIITRVFELFYDKYVSHTYNSFISKRQFEFQNKSSTSCELIRTLNDTFALKHESNYCLVVASDMTKAFDTVFHKAIFDGIGVCSPPLNVSMTFSKIFSLVELNTQREMVTFLEQQVSTSVFRKEL